MLVLLWHRFDITRFPGQIRHCLDLESFHITPNNGFQKREKSMVTSCSSPKQLRTKPTPSVFYFWSTGTDEWIKSRNWFLAQNPLGFNLTRYFIKLLFVHIAWLFVWIELWNSSCLLDLFDSWNEIILNEVQQRQSLLANSALIVISKHRKQAWNLQHCRASKQRDDLTIFERFLSAIALTRVCVLSSIYAIECSNGSKGLRVSRSIIFPTTADNRNTPKNKATSSSLMELILCCSASSKRISALVYEPESYNVWLRTT